MSNGCKRVWMVVETFDKKYSILESECPYHVQNVNNINEINEETISKQLEELKV